MKPRGDKHLPTHLLTRGGASLVTHGQLAVHIGPVRQIAVDHQALRCGLLVSGADLIAHPGGAGRACAALLDKDNLLLIIVLWVWPLGHPAVLHQHVDVPICQHTHCTSATAYRCPHLSTYTLYVSNSIHMSPSVNTHTVRQQQHTHVPICQHTHCTSATAYGCPYLSTHHSTSAATSVKRSLYIRAWMFPTFHIPLYQHMMSNVGFKTIITILLKSIQGKFYSQIR